MSFGVFKVAILVSPTDQLICMFLSETVWPVAINTSGDNTCADAKLIPMNTRQRKASFLMSIANKNKIIYRNQDQEGTDLNKQFIKFIYKSE